MTKKSKYITPDYVKKFVDDEEKKLKKEWGALPSFVQDAYIRALVKNMVVLCGIDKMVLLLKEQGFTVVAADNVDNEPKRKR